MTSHNDDMCRHLAEMQATYAALCGKIFSEVVGCKERKRETLRDMAVQQRYLRKLIQNLQRSLEEHGPQTDQ